MDVKLSQKYDSRSVLRCIIAIQSATLKSSGFLPNSKKGARSAASRDQKNSQFNSGLRTRHAVGNQIADGNPKRRVKNSKFQRFFSPIRKHLELR